MKKTVIIVVATLIAAVLSPFGARAAELTDIISESAVLMDAETGQILFDKNGGNVMYPASTTKIITGLLAAERCGMDEIAEVSKTAVDIDEWNSANIALSPGERMPVDSLMYGIMLPSANDAANVLAEHIAGNQRDFAQIMTERARLAGAMSTRFTNAHGLHDPNHYTTARDMAKITREAIKNPVFMRYFGAGTHTIPPTNLQPLERPFTNYQYMLVNSTRFYNPDVIGGKVGYTLEAKHTMSTAATRGGRTLICVVMYSQNRDEKFADTKKLLDFGFGEFTKITVPKRDFPGFSVEIMSGGEQSGTAEFTGETDFTALLHNSIDPASVEIRYSHEYPFEEGESIESYAEFTVESGNPAIPALLGAVKLSSGITGLERVESATLSFRDDMASIFHTRPWIVPLAAAGVVFIVAATLVIIRQISVSRQRRRRRERLARLQREREMPYRGTVPTVSARK